MMRTLLLPDRRRSKGTGHFRRCVALLGHLKDSVIYVPEEVGSDERSRVDFAELLRDAPTGSVVSERSGQAWPMVVVDLFDGPKELIDSFPDSVTVGIDVGGRAREYCSYVIDTLPRVDDSMYNEFDRSYLDLPPPALLGAEATGKILVSFGGEDPAGLTEPTVRALLNTGVVTPELVTAMRPALRSLQSLPDGVQVLDPVPNLATVIKEHEYVITSFGLTAYEAAAVGRSVLLVNPTKYHARLARRSGLATAGAGSPSPRILRNWLARPDEDLSRPPRRRAATRSRVPQERTLQNDQSGPESLASRLSGMVIPHRLGCPVHRGVRGPAVWRGKDKSYFRCPECQGIYVERLTDDEESYAIDYFDNEYRAQYGRTYAEDFEHIKEMGRRRLQRIRTIAPGVSTLLDVGCALGPFLSAAEDAGMAAYGVDISEDAVAQARERGFTAECASVFQFDPEATLGCPEFDVVSLWYVIEHFYDLDEVLHRLRTWVKPGGVLAIATPHGGGVSSRTRTDQFYLSSPRDHYTMWDRRSAKKILGEFGFSIRRFTITGHHPERYPGLARLLPESIRAAHSWLFGWGDTFEIYARKE